VVSRGGGADRLSRLSRPSGARRQLPPGGLRRWQSIPTRGGARADEDLCVCAQCNPCGAGGPAAPVDCANDVPRRYSGRSRLQSKRACRLCVPGRHHGGSGRAGRLWPGSSLCNVRVHGLSVTAMQLRQPLKVSVHGWRVTSV
jgi:hypothetical protein